MRAVRFSSAFSILLLCSYAALAQSPVIGVAKDESHAGREITLTFYLENLGSVALSNVSLDEDLDAAFGAGNYTINVAPFFVSSPGTLTLNASFDGSGDTAILASGTLAVGATATISMTVEITTLADLGMGLGTYSNQVTATAEDMTMAMTSDLSDDGTDPDPNGNGDPTDAGEDDPTIIAILERPALGVAKSASLSGSQVTLDFYLENLGNVALSNVSLTDNLDAVFGAGNYSVTSAPTFLDDPGSITLNGGFDGSASPDLISSGSLALADTARIRIVVDVTTLTDQGNGLGVYSNQATASGESPNGASNSDLSDDGTDPDPNGDGNPNEAGENDPTVIVIGEEPALGAAKTASVSGSLVTVDLYLENLGNVTLANLSLVDDLNAVFGPSNFFVSTAPSFIDDPGTITLNPAFDGNFDTQLLTVGSSSLAVADTAQIRFVVTLVQIADLGLGLGSYSNQVSTSAIAPGGGLAQDLSDDGTDPDPNGNGDPTEAGENDATLFMVAPTAVIGIAKDYINLGGVSPLIELRFTLVNYGNQRVSSLTISDNLNSVYGAGNFAHITDPEPVSGATTLNYNAAYNGNTNTSLLTAGSYLDPGESVTFRIQESVTNITDQGFGLGIYQNQVTVNGLDPAANPVSDVSQEGADPDPGGDGNPSEMDPTVINVNAVASVGAAKDVSVTGNQVTFDVYLENLGNQPLTQLGVADNLDLVFGAGNYSVTTSPFLVDDPGTLTLNGGYDGSVGNNELLVPASSGLVIADTAQIRWVVTVSNVQDQGLGLGNYSNQTLVSAFGGGALVTDSSDFGTDPDPNGNGNANEGGENDPTTFSLVVDSPIGVAKQAMVTGFSVTIDLYLENLGPSMLSNVSLVDDLDATFGNGNYTITSPPSLVVDPGTLVLNGAYDGSADTNILTGASTLAAGATAQIQLVLTVTTESDQGNGYGVYSNQAQAAGLQPSGVLVSDFSDDGTDPDPNGNGNPGEAGENDPTPIVITGNPAVGVAKKATVIGTLVTFDFYVENLGDVTLTNFFLDDPLNPVFGAGNYSIMTQPFQVSGPGTLLLSPQFFGFNIFSRVVLGGFLRPGEVEHFRTQINISTPFADVGNGPGVYFNGVTVTATDPGGNMVMDDSDDGYDPDPNGNGNAGDAGEDDATQIIMGDEANLGVAKTATTSGQQVTFDLYLENFGNSILSGLSLQENLDAVFGAGNYSLNGTPTLIDDPGTILFDPAFDGSSNTELLLPASTLPPFDTAQIRVVVDVTTVSDQGLGFGNYVNQVSTSGSAPLGSFTMDLSDSGTDPDPSGNGFPNDANEDDPTPFSVGITFIGAAKNATVAGNLVTFDYYVENLDAVFGAGNYVVTSGPTIIGPPRDLVVNPGFDGSSDTALIASGGLLIGVTEHIQIQVDVLTLIDSGSGLGVYTNQVTVLSDTASDLSDAGTDPDPNGNDDPTEAGENDPTTFSITQVPTIGVAKTASVSGRTVTIDLYLEAFGNVNLSNVSLIEGLDGLFGAGNYTITSAPALIVNPGSLVLNGAFDGSGNTDILTNASTLALGATAQIRFAVQVTTVTDQGLGLGIYDNQVSAGGNAPNGTPTSDLSDNGTDPDSNGNGDPTEAGENDPSPIVLEGTLGDFVWNDLNGDGIQDAGEPGLSGIAVFLDSNNNGTIDAGEPMEVTDGAGAYDFTNVAAGSYTVRVATGTVPVGFNLTTANIPLSVTLFAGEDYNTADFGYQQQDATIGDRVWNDLDGDGVDDPGEPGIAGVTVFLDSNNNGMLDGGEPMAIAVASGAYDLTGLATGSYTVRVDNTTLPAGFVLTTGNLPLMVNLAAGEDFNDADFGYQQQDATIGDRVWNDLNGDGVQDPGEPGIAGVTVFLDLNNNGALDGGEPSQVTDGVGAYDFTGLATGTYTVRVDATTVPAGFVLTTGNLPLTVNLAAGEDFNDADFGYQQQDATIGDFVWNDLSGDGSQDAGEPGIAGVTVFLDSNNNGTLDGGEPTQATDGVGAYDFTGLATGTYTVRVDSSTLPPGLALTTANLPLTVNLAAGEDFNDADFGYVDVGSIIGVAKSGTANQLDIRYTFHVENFGSTMLTGLSMLEDLDAVFGAATYVVSEAPNVVAGAATATGNTAFDGSTDAELFAAGSSLGVGAFVDLTIVVTITDLPPSTVSFSNQVTVTAMGPLGNLVSDTSTEGSDPDGDGNGNPGNDASPTVVMLSAVTIPTLGVWGLLLLALGLAVLTLRRLR